MAWDANDLFESTSKGVVAIQPGRSSIARRLLPARKAREYADSPSLMSSRQSFAALAARILILSPSLMSWDCIRGFGCAGVPCCCCTCSTARATTVSKRALDPGPGIERPFACR